MTCDQTAPNSCSTRLGGSSKSYFASSASSRDFFHFSACLRVEIALHGLADGALERIERIHAELLGQFVVDLGLTRLLHILHGHCEGGGLAGEMRRAVIFREGHLDRLLVTRLHAEELILENRG